MSKLFFISGFVMSSALLLAQGKAETPSGLVPVKMIVTVEARHGKDVPSLHPEDVMAYQRNGFSIADSIVVDIGNGFVMDDYVMQKTL